MLAADFISLLSFALIIYVAAIAIIFYRKAHMKAKAHEKAKYTYEFCLERHEVLNQLFENMVDRNERVVTDIRLEKYEMRAVEIFNEISIGVNHNILNEDIVRSMFEGIFISYFKRNKYFMYSTGDELNNPYLFNEFQVLIEKWEREPMKNKRFS